MQTDALRALAKKSNIVIFVLNVKKMTQKR